MKIPYPNISSLYRFSLFPSFFVLIWVLFCSKIFNFLKKFQWFFCEFFTFDWEFSIILFRGSFPHYFFLHIKGNPNNNFTQKPQEKVPKSQQKLEKLSNLVSRVSIIFFCQFLWEIHLFAFTINWVNFSSVKMECRWTRSSGDQI